VQICLSQRVKKVITILCSWQGLATLIFSKIYDLLFCESSYFSYHVSYETNTVSILQINNHNLGYLEWCVLLNIIFFGETLQESVASGRTLLPQHLLDKILGTNFFSSLIFEVYWAGKHVCKLQYDFNVLRLRYNPALQVQA